MKRTGETAKFRLALDAAANKLSGPSRERAKRQARMLLKAGVDSIPSLLHLIESEDARPSRRVGACWFAGRLGRKRAGTSLLIALSSADQSLAWEAAGSLSLLMSKRTVGPLVAELLSAPASERRTCAAYALRGVKDPRVLTALMSVVENTGEDAKVRGFAAESLCFIGSKRAYKPLIRALADPSTEVRFWAAFALGQIRCRAALPHLRRLAATDRRRLAGWWSVSREAADAIKAIECGFREANVSKQKGRT
jgi:HEAT repeat protein